MLLVYHGIVPTALVLSAGGMFAAWEVGVLKALEDVLDPDLIVGASAGAWNGWAFAGGATIEELEQEWMDPRTADLMRFRPHRWGLIPPEPLHEKARELYARYRPRVPFGLTTVELPGLRPRVIGADEISWRHLAATCSIPFCYPPVEIDGARYVDGGLLGALPLWAAQQMGATRAIALNCLTNPSLRFMHLMFHPPAPGAEFQVVRIEPSVSLGWIQAAAVWSERNIARWIEQGFADGNRARTSITM